MKKITLLAALLGATYFTNAQVGIGTPTPANASQLDITASNKGLLIPRVNLTELTVYSPIVGDKVESLLVYNIANTVTVPSGFYYWTIDTENPNGYWNRIVGKAELDQVIENLGDNLTTIEGDIANLKAVINYILPSNPSNDNATPETHTTVVYKEGKFYTVTYDNTTQTYITQEINFEDLVNGFETKTFVREVRDIAGKVTGFIYFSEQTIIDWLAANPASPIANIPNDAPGAMAIDVKGTVVNNIQEILESPTTIIIDGNTFNTVEEYLQYITQFSNGNVIYTQIDDPVNAGQKIWVFQYWDEASESYITIKLKDLVAGFETKTFVREVKDLNDKVTGFIYFSEQTIIDWLAANPTNTIADIPNNAPGAMAIDVKGTVVNNIQEILESPTTITITTVEGDKTFTTVEEYLQYITQFSNGNVIYKEIADPDNAGQTIWVFQYWDEASESYITIKLKDLVAGFETKTQILRSEVATNGTLPAFSATRTKPVEATVKKGQIFYQYNAEGDQVDYINLTEDMLTSITNNEDIQNAITNILNEGGNVYFGDHDNDPNTPHTLHQIVTDSTTGVTTNEEIVLPASLVVNTIKNDTNLTIKQALGDHLNSTTNVVYTGNTYNNKKVYLAKGTTTISAYSAIATPVTISGVTVSEVLSIKLLKGTNVITSSTTDVNIENGAVKFNIGVGNQYFMLPAGDYDVVIEFASTETIQP